VSRQLLQPEEDTLTTRRGPNTDERLEREARKKKEEALKNVYGASVKRLPVGLSATKRRKVQPRREKKATEDNERDRKKKGEKGRKKLSGGGKN